MTTESTNIWLTDPLILFNKEQINQIWPKQNMSRNEKIKDIIGGMLANEVARGDLTNPLFYYKILFS